MIAKDERELTIEIIKAYASMDADLFATYAHAAAFARHDIRYRQMIRSLLDLVNEGRVLYVPYDDGAGGLYMWNYAYKDVSK